MRNKIKKPKKLTEQQKDDVNWIISCIVKNEENSFNAVNIYFKEYKIKYRYKIEIKRK